MHLDVDIATPLRSKGLAESRPGLNSLTESQSPRGMPSIELWRVRILFGCQGPFLFVSGSCFFSVCSCCCFFFLLSLVCWLSLSVFFLFFCLLFCLVVFLFFVFGCMFPASLGGLPAANGLLLRFATLLWNCVRFFLYSASSVHVSYPNCYRRDLPRTALRGHRCAMDVSITLR